MIGLNSDVEWVTSQGNFPGIIIQGAGASGTFAGETRWVVRLVSGAAYTLEGRDLIEAVLSPADALILRGIALPVVTTASIAVATPPAVTVPVITQLQTPTGGAQVLDPTMSLVSTATPGQDLRPSGSNGTLPAVAAVGGALVLATVALARLTPVLATSARTFLGRFVAGTNIAWSSLPGWLRAALTLVGLGGSTLVMDDVIGAIVPSGGDGIAIPMPGGGGLPQVQVVGSWVANGVVFYRLADGKLAVQNKKGRWKVWRPKRPIVLYADGASNIKTMLRADRALDKQAKQIAKMLNRRAPKTRKSPPAKGGRQIIVAQDGSKVVDV